MTVTFRHSLPVWYERGVTYTSTFPVHVDAALTAPTAGTFTLKDGSGNTVVTGSVTVSGSIAQYTISDTDTSALDLADDWMEHWTLTVGGQVYTRRRQALLCVQAPYNVFAENDLHRLHPTWARQKPPAWTSWQPAIDEALIEVYAGLLQRGHAVHEIRNWYALRKLIRVETELAALGAMITGGADSRHWLDQARDQRKIVRDAWDDLKLDFDTDEDGTVDSEGEAAEPPLFLTEIPDTFFPDWSY